MAAGEAALLRGQFVTARWSDFLFQHGYVKSKKEAQRLIAAGAFDVGECPVITDVIPPVFLMQKYGVVGIKVGKHQFGTVLFEHGEITLINREPLRRAVFQSVGMGGWRFVSTT